jgi:hypothetical protein
MVQLHHGSPIIESIKKMDKKDLEKYFLDKGLDYCKLEKIISKEISMLDKILICLAYTRNEYNNSEATLSSFVKDCYESSQLDIGVSEASKIRNKAIYAAINILKYDEYNVEGLTCDSHEFNQIFEVAEKYIRLSIFV